MTKTKKKTTKLLPCATVPTFVPVQGQRVQLTPRSWRRYLEYYPASPKEQGTIVKVRKVYDLGYDLVVVWDGDEKRRKSHWGDQHLRPSKK